MGAAGAKGLESSPSGMNVEDADNDEDVRTKNGYSRYKNVKWTKGQY